MSDSLKNIYQLYQLLSTEKRRFWFTVEERTILYIKTRVKITKRTIIIVRIIKKKGIQLYMILMR